MFGKQLICVVIMPPLQNVLPNYCHICVKMIPNHLRPSLHHSRAVGPTLFLPFFTVIPEVVSFGRYLKAFVFFRYYGVVTLASILQVSVAGSVAQHDQRTKNS